MLAQSSWAQPVMTWRGVSHSFECMSDLCELTARFTLAGHKGRPGETGKWCEEMNGECTKWKEGKLFLVQRIVEVEYGHQLLHFHDPLNCAKPEHGNRNWSQAGQQVNLEEPLKYGESQLYLVPNFRNIFYSFRYFSFSFPSWNSNPRRFFCSGSLSWFWKKSNIYGIARCSWPEWKQHDPQCHGFRTTENLTCPLRIFLQMLLISLHETLTQMAFWLPLQETAWVKVIHKSLQ